MKGKCVNLDCPEFGKIVDIPDGEDFVCKNPECGHKLHEVTDKESGFSEWIKEHKLLLIIAAAIVILAIGGILLFNGDVGSVTPPDKIYVE